MRGLIRHRVFATILVGTIVALTCLYVVYAERTPPPWDPSSLVIMARSLVQGGGIHYYDANNALIGPYFNPHGFDIRAPRDPQPYSVFPPGFPLILSVAYLLGGPNRLYLVPPLFGVMTLGAAAYLGYIIGNRPGSILATILVGTSRVVATFTTSLWSDGPSLGLLLLALAGYA